MKDLVSGAKYVRKIGYRVINLSHPVDGSRSHMLLWWDCVRIWRIAHCATCGRLPPFPRTSNCWFRCSSVLFFLPLSTAPAPPPPHGLSVDSIILAFRSTSVFVYHGKVLLTLRLLTSFSPLIFFSFFPIDVLGLYNHRSSSFIYETVIECGHTQPWFTMFRC